MDIDFSKMTLKEIKEVQTQAARAAATFEDRRKKDALAELEAKARDMGYSLQELLGTPAPRKPRAPASAKYANPANRSETWSGRGRKPRWYEAALKSGKKPEDMAV